MQRDNPHLSVSVEDGSLEVRFKSRLLGPFALYFKRSLALYGIVYAICYGTIFSVMWLPVMDNELLFSGTCVLIGVLTAFLLRGKIAKMPVVYYILMMGLWYFLTLCISYPIWQLAHRYDLYETMMWIFLIVPDLGTVAIHVSQAFIGHTAAALLLRALRRLPASAR